MTAKRSVDPLICLETPDVYASPMPGAVPVVSSSSRTTGVLVQLPASMFEDIFSFGVFKLVVRSRFHAGRILLSLYRSCEVEWE